MPILEHDSNRGLQRELAKKAKMNGFTKAVRLIEPGACDWCVAHEGETVDIDSVISGDADHPNGKCYYRFLP
jgi:hypothetical protein